MAKISTDLPDYLRTPHSIVHSKSTRMSGKSLKTALTQGVSIEAPDFFRVSKVPVLSPESKKHLYSKDGDRFICDLKKSSVNPSSNFQYSDYQSSPYDYDSITLANQIDLNADRKPLLKKRGGFGTLYEKHLDKGFGVLRGQFTFESNTPKILRNHSHKIKTLEKILKKTHKNKKKSKINQYPDVPSISKQISSILISRKSTPNEKLKREIDTFEDKLTRKNSLGANRAFYIIHK
jgi:hypothetical protein